MSINRDQLLEILSQPETQGGRAYDRKNPPRGLPDHDALLSLAQTYLVEQAKHWPQHNRTELIPAPTPKVLEAMATAFEEMYFTGVIQEFDRHSLPSDVGIAAVYTRYSDANSNPRSLDQQLANALTTAVRERYFVPWVYIFADAATTGTNDGRRGYRLVKQLIPRVVSPISALIIDELGRANRDLMESLALSKLIESYQRRLIGHSDGFDSANQMAKWQVAIMGVMNEEFIKQLKAKVNRGMNDAFALGKPVFHPGFGYTLEPELGSDGMPIVSPNGKIPKRVVVNKEEAEQVRRIFRLYAEEGKSTMEISRLLNMEKVGNRSWTASQVRSLLKRELYHGREPWGKSRCEFDTETETRKTVRVAEDLWQWREMEHLRIVDEALWEATQARRELRKKAYNRKDPSVSRVQVSGKNLFYLVCGHCGLDMLHDRGSKRPVVRCSKGRAGSCPGFNGKTLQHIEESILNFLLGQLASATFVDKIVAAANDYLRQLESRPITNVGAFQKQIAKKEAARLRMIKKLEEADDDNSFDALYATVETLRREVQQLKTDVAAATVEPAALTPIRREDFASLIGSLRGLLYENSSLSGAVLKKLTGPIKLLQSAPLPGMKRKQWSAEFTLCHAKVFAEIARQTNCPGTATWEFLSSRGWTFGGCVSVEVRHFENAERIAETVVEMLGAGTTRKAAAIALGVDPVTVDAAIRAWEAGNRCYLPPIDFTFRRHLKASKSGAIASDVVRMIDGGMTVKDVAIKLNASEPLVSRTYKQAKADQAMELAKEGKQFKIACPLKLPKEKHDRIRELLLTTNMSYRAIARAVGCNHHAVSDAKKRLDKENGK